MFGISHRVKFLMSLCILSGFFLGQASNHDLSCWQFVIAIILMVVALYLQGVLDDILKRRDIE